MAEEILESVVETPAIVLEKTIVAGKKISEYAKKERYFKKAREYWHNLGPGLTTGAADDDPSGIATYSQTGAQYGFSLIWLSLFSFPFMAIVQEMCARIGMVTGMGLAANIRRLFPKQVIYICSILLFVANTLNLGADIGAMAKATQLLININFAWVVIGFSALTLGLQIFTTYNQFAKYLKLLALILVSYILTALFIDIDWTVVLKHLVIPSITFSKDQLFLICAILGTTISPYLFFWQTSQEVEEQILEGKVNISQRQEESTPAEMKDMRVDVWSGMFVSNLIMFFIIAATAATLYASGQRDITTSAQAASALRPLAGNYAYLLFTLGIIGTGVLAVPVLAGSASYALSESFGWKFGLYRKLEHAYSFYGIIIISTLIGLAINFIGWDPIKVLIYSAVANGLIAPLILALIVIISSKKAIMGKWTNKPLTTILGWMVTVAMVISGVAAIFGLISG